MVRLSGSILTLGVSKEEAKTNLCPLLDDRLWPKADPNLSSF